MMAQSRLVSGIVNRDEEHILLVYDDVNEVNPEDFIPVALVAPGPGDGFTVKYIIAAHDSDARSMVKEVQEELEYHLIKLGEADPWAYAVYHCGTASNWYSRVHWCWLHAGCVRSAS